MLSAWSLTFCSSYLEKMRDEVVVSNFLLAARGQQVNPLAFLEISEENRVFVRESLTLDRAASLLGAQLFTDEQFRREFSVRSFKREDFLRYLKITLLDRKDFDAERVLTDL